MQPTPSSTLAPMMALPTRNLTRMKSVIARTDRARRGKTSAAKHRFAVSEARRPGIGRRPEAWPCSVLQVAAVCAKNRIFHLFSEGLILSLCHDVGVACAVDGVESDDGPWRPWSDRAPGLRQLLLADRVSRATPSIRSISIGIFGVV